MDSKREKRWTVLDTVDIQSHVFSFLDAESLCSAGRVSKRWSATAQKQHLWQELYLQKNGPTAAREAKAAGGAGIDWKMCYFQADSSWASLMRSRRSLVTFFGWQSILVLLGCLVFAAWNAYLMRVQHVAVSKSPAVPVAVHAWTISHRIVEDDDGDFAVTYSLDLDMRWPKESPDANKSVEYTTYVLDTPLGVSLNSSLSLLRRVHAPSYRKALATCDARAAALLDLQANAERPSRVFCHSSGKSAADGRLAADDRSMADDNVCNERVCSADAEEYAVVFARGDGTHFLIRTYVTYPYVWLGIVASVGLITVAWACRLDRTGTRPLVPGIPRMEFHRGSGRWAYRLLDSREVTHRRLLRALLIVLAAFHAMTTAPLIHVLFVVPRTCLDNSAASLLLYVFVAALAISAYPTLLALRCWRHVWMLRSIQMYNFSGPDLVKGESDSLLVKLDPRFRLRIEDLTLRLQCCETYTELVRRRNGDLEERKNVRVLCEHAFPVLGQGIPLEIAHEYGFECKARVPGTDDIRVSSTGPPPYCTWFLAAIVNVRMVGGGVWRCCAVPTHRLVKEVAVQVSQRR